MWWTGHSCQLGGSGRLKRGEKLGEPLIWLTIFGEATPLAAAILWVVSLSFYSRTGRRRALHPWGPNMARGCSDPRCPCQEDHLLEVVETEFSALKGAILIAQNELDGCRVSLRAAMRLIEDQRRDLAQVRARLIDVTQQRDNLLLSDG